MFRVGWLDDPEEDDPEFETMDEAKAANPRAGMATLGIWDESDGSRLVSVYWQENWYDVV